MRWAQTGRYASKPTWHLADPANAERVPGVTSKVVSACGESIYLPKWMPEDRRPALGRNNVCARCRARYLKTRPDLKGYFDRLNDTRDV